MRAAKPGDILEELDPDASAGGGGGAPFSSEALDTITISPLAVEDSELLFIACIACTRAATPAGAAPAAAPTPPLGEDAPDEAGAAAGASSWLPVEDDECIFMACIRAARPGDTRGESLGFPSADAEGAAAGGCGGGGGEEEEGEELSRPSASRAAPVDLSESNDCSCTHQQV